MAEFGGSGASASADGGASAGGGASAAVSESLTGWMFDPQYLQFFEIIDAGQHKSAGGGGPSSPDAVMGYDCALQTLFFLGGNVFHEGTMLSHRQIERLIKDCGTSGFNLDIACYQYWKAMGKPSPLS